MFTDGAGTSSKMEPPQMMEDIARPIKDSIISKSTNLTREVSMSQMFQSKARKLRIIQKKGKKHIKMSLIDMKLTRVSLFTNVVLYPAE